MINSLNLNWFVSKGNKSVFKIGLYHSVKKVNFKYSDLNKILTISTKIAKSNDTAIDIRLSMSLEQASEFIENLVSNNEGYLIPEICKKDYLNEFRSELSYRYSDGYNHYWQTRENEDRWTVSMSYFYTEEELIKKGCIIVYKEE